MPLPEKVINALIFAEQVHKGQKRKGKDVPAMTHLSAVLMSVMGVSMNQDLWAAAPLHDTVEDCKPYGSVTIQDIAEQFGPEVARMVADVTEVDKTLPWATRKQQAVEHIADMSEDSLILKTADVLHNLSELLEDLERDGESVFEMFNRDKSLTIGQFVKVVNALKERWPENPLLPKVEAGLQKLLLWL